MALVKFSLYRQAILRKYDLPKEVIIGWVSSLIEAYNMAIYSFIAPFLAKFMFQEASAWSRYIFFL